MAVWWLYLVPVACVSVPIGMKTKRDRKRERKGERKGDAKTDKKRERKRKSLCNQL
jgi:hypothetical protein